MSSVFHRGFCSTVFFMILFVQLNQLAHAGVELGDYQAAADKLAEDLNKRSGAVFSEMLDLDAIIDTALANTEYSSRQMSALRMGILKGRPELVNNIVSQVYENGYVKVIRVRDGGKYVRALIRLDLGDQGYGYMDLHLVKRGNKIRIVDWYDYTKGQTFAHGLNQVIAMMTPTPTVVGKIFDMASGRGDDIDNLQKFLVFLSKKQYDSAKEVYAHLSEEVANSRSVLVMMVFAASASQVDGDYFDALARLDKYHGRDSSLAFILLDYYYLSGDYDKVISVVDSLLKEFGVEDAALLAVEANALSDKGDHKHAIEKAMRAATLEPGLEGVYWALLNSNVGAKNYGDAVVAADMLERKFDYLLNEETLSDADVFKGFLASKEFKAWKAGKKE